MQRGQAPTLPDEPATAEHVIPVLNLPDETIIEVCTAALVLMEPFSRSSDATVRILNCETDAIELEVTTHGNTGLIQSVSQQLQSLEGLFVVNGTQPLSSTLQLIRSALLEPVVAGCRWQLAEKGLLDASPDPTRVSIAGQLAKLEERLSALEGAAKA